MRQQLIKRLYEILKTHETKHGYLYLKDTIPQMFTSGVYFFFDKTTPIENNQFKITYIGITNPNKNNRLHKHKNNNGPSSFRDSVKKAISNKFGINETLSVNDYIHNLPYIFILINNREVIENIEQRTIELISNYEQAKQIHVPNDQWLGYSSNKEKVRSSHIWNSNYVMNYSLDYNYVEALNQLEQYSNNMII
jgi:hypothetical protein